MKWFCANLVFVVISDIENQSSFPVFETSFLLAAESWNEADHKARNLGLEEQNLNSGLEYNGVPALKKFLGIRKLKLTHNLEEDDEIGDSRPNDFTEMMESYFEVDSIEKAQALANGKRVCVSYVDDAD